MYLSDLQFIFDLALVQVGEMTESILADYGSARMIASHL